MNDSYSCYVYLCINHIHNTYPIQDAKRHLDKILELKKGDVLHIKGLGELTVNIVDMRETVLADKKENFIYKEVGVQCTTLHERA